MRTCFTGVSSIETERTARASSAGNASARCQEATVDLIDDLEVSGEPNLEEVDRPFF
jgi:hypothetical protein